MKNLSAITAATASLLATDVALAQNSNMMNGGMWDGGWMGGYGGIWGPIALVVVIGLLAWVVMQKRK